MQLQLRNTGQTYGVIAKSLHWVIAALILILIPLGIYANGLPYDTAAQLARKGQLFSLHKTLGVLVFFLAVARLLWAASNPRPAPLHPDRRLEHLAAQTVHWLLYGSIVLVPLSGWLHHAATSGFAPILWPFGQNLPLVPKSETLAALTAGLHIVLERVLALSVLLHIAGALKHHLIDRDVTLRRMIWGQINTPPSAAAPPPSPARARLPARLPLVAALLLWMAALVTGGALGLYTPHRPPLAGPAPGTALTTVPTTAHTLPGREWIVQSGQIALEIKQFNSIVTGQFDDWQAHITYDPDRATGQASVTINPASLRLGSLTSEALGPDFLAPGRFAQAQFSAALNQGTATGHLTLRGQTVPVTFPYQLSLDAQAAQVQATLSLDRRDFGIGLKLDDPATLDYAVAVKITLTANRAP